MSRFAARPKGAYRIVTTLFACAYLLGGGVPVLASSRPVETLTLPDGRIATVSANGIATVYNPQTHAVTRQDVRVHYAGSATSKLLGKEQILRKLITQTAVSGAGYALGRVIVVYGDGVSPMSDSLVVPDAQLERIQAAALSKTALSPADVPSYTNNSATNAVLGSLGVIGQQRLFSAVNRSTLAAPAAETFGATLPNLENAYRLSVAVSVHDAVAALQETPGVEYVSPDWFVTPQHTPAYPVPAAARERALSAASRIPAAYGKSRRTTLGWTLQPLSTTTVPTNYALSSSEQSLLNASSLNASAAYDLITQKYNQLPGTGEIITNVSLGDLTDASEVAPGDPCMTNVQVAGPTTIVSGGQRYLDWPSMPLIPTFTADTKGNLNGDGEVCNVDPYLDEIGLDFAMMAPLPHNAQRSSNPGSGLTDLLGIAPGASYRLIVPASFTPTYSDVDAALMAAGQQNPPPNVITASLGFGEDAFGFPGRYLEDDPITQSVIASLVKKGIVVCISAGDGIREYTEVAISPSGGSAPTNVLTSGGTATTLSDIAFSTTPSVDRDTGSIDVGGTTLDDIFAAPPQNPSNAALAAQHAFAETRWTGFRGFSSGFGTRVDVAAPSDNVVGFARTIGGTAQTVVPVISGGTSASAPEVAAAAAVVMQVARLTGHALSSPAAVRSFLESTGTTVPAVPQSDVVNAIGPQVNLGNAVSTLFANAGISIPPAVARVAVEQRRDADYDGDAFPYSVTLDGTFESDTDPTNIDLAGPTLSSTDSTPTAANSLAWITLAPDWEGLPSKATFKLVATKTGTVAATTPWARLLPQTLITDAGLSFTSSSSRTVTYTYSAYDGKKVIASATIPLTFGPFNSKVFFVPAPSVPAVETKSSIPVTYNLSNVLDLSNPTLIVSRPGRVDPVSGEIFDPAYTVALSETSGTVNVPVSKLYGAGIYGIGIQWSTYQGYPVYSDFAFVQVAPPATLRPAAPLLSINKSTPGHDLEVPFDTPFQVSWDVRNISKATGAMLEISAPGPAIGGEYESFNNPNGSVRDADGIDTGSVYFASVGTNGTVTINPATAGMTPTFNHVVRVLPVSGSTVVGEAGDVSSVTEDGVVPVDGNPISGFGIDQNGSDGILTTDYIEQPDGTSEAGAVEVFNQSTGQSTHSTKSSKEGYIGPYDVFGGDVALYASDGATNFKTLDPASTFKSGPTFSPPSGVALGSAAENQTNDTGLFIADDTNGTPYVVSTDLLTSTSTTINIQPYLDQSFPAAIAQDTTNNLAYVGFDPSNGNCTSGPGLLTVDVSAQSSSSVTVTGIGNGGAFGVTFDPSQNTVGLLPNCANNVGFYNLKTKSTIVAPIPPLSFTQDGASALYDLVLDPVNHLVLVIDTAPQDIFTNNNGMYSVVVIDEKTGNIVETIEKFGAANNLAFSGGLSASQPSLLINPSQREGWFSSFGFQLQPFTY